jgi:acyl carrier protein
MESTFMTEDKKQAHAQSVVKLVASTLGIAEDELNLGSSMDNTPAWDSLEHMTICLAFERQFEIKLNMDNIISATSVRALAALIP